MELKTYIKELKKFSVFIIIFTILGGLLAFFLTSKSPTGFVVSQTFIITSTSQLKNQSLPENSTFFSQELARNFTDSAVAILESSDFKSLVLKENQTLQVRKISPQVIRLTAVANDSSSAKELLEKTPLIFNSKINSLNDPIPSVNLKEIAKIQEPTTTKADRRIFTSGGLVLGFAFSILTVSLKSYFKV